MKFALMSSTLYTNKTKKRLPNLLIYNFLSSDYLLNSEYNYAVFNNNQNNGYENLLFITSNKLSISDISDISTYSNQWLYGYIAYDYKNNIENLSSDNEDNLMFENFHFFIPEIVIGFNETNYSFLFSSNNKLKSEIEKILNTSNSLKNIKKINYCLNIKQKITKNEYIQAVENLKKHIKQGDIYEINFCHEFYANNCDVNPSQLYIDLITESPTPFSVFLKHGNKFLISASPERFIKKNGNKIISQPIKGTIKRDLNHPENDKTLKETLQNDPKERSENIMIVDLVRNDLSKIAQKNSVSVDELCEIYSFPQVHQMISTVSATVKEKVTFKDIIHATFPMGSMTGAPKIRAMQLIEKYEKTKRGLYSGTVGYIKPNGDFDFNVVIRSILYNREKKYLSFMVGGAITFLSDPEKEYNETLLKASAILKTLTND
jgi:para-aminobenzoate synthetase component 1